MGKRCSTCHENRPLTAYNRRASAPDGLQARCRDCARDWYVAHRIEHMRNTARRTQETRRDHQLRLGRYLSEHPCVDCGETDVRCLEFDHEVPADKTTDVTTLASTGTSWQRVLDEIAKCSVRCSNCHRRRTVRMLGGWREAFHQAQVWTGAPERLASILPREG